MRQSVVLETLSYFFITWSFLFQLLTQLHQLLLLLVAFLSDSFVELEQLIIHYTQLIPPNTEAWRHEYSALLSMLIVRLACTMIFCASDYHSVSIFHLSRYKKLFLLSLKQQFTGHFAPFLSFNSWKLAPNFLAFKSIQ